MQRREFIQTSLLSAAVMGFAPNIVFGGDDRKAQLGFIGVGLRGRSHLRQALRRDDVEVKAICDIDADALAEAQKLIKDAGKKNAKEFTGDDHAFLKLLENNDIDGVVIATPWLWHTPMAVAAMKAGKYAGVEVSAANTLQECWDLVNTYEETNVPCMILENVCYRRDVMAILHMVRKGMFGELVHMECGYQHDLREVKFNNGSKSGGDGVEFGDKAFSEARWRTLHSVKRNGDLYPTHGIGPVGTMLDINRGNRFVTLTATASKTRGLHNYIIEKGGDNHPNANVRFHLGDVVTSVIKTANGETVMVQHDTNLPRPYSLGFRVQGTKGLWMDINDSLYIEGTSPAHRWESDQKYMQEYDHPLWKKYESLASGAGHGGMDWFVLHAFVESIKRKVDTPLDAYDAAAWSAISPLSEQSIAMGSAPQPFPNFTRGKWINRKPVFALDDSY
ncbi:MAG: Gfo/Idh/MocA family oxidoreductase [Deferribacteres bacterium]|nr:Gfo/Idh/MocA family oxidoreductase [candidate division KSB1 bacterium]MCB9501327.1 Gfo/Idh/MocA family oxidoreductase [Deferribacteres bacterium]